ncbi:hypothetical protein Hrubri_4137 [Herbaspirillum rubrisubalbicans M1]|uniref:hypothetical protein n=1 Tax=Herbaspirillum rubrisubalbicans TaxID=80842 RepID=UPI00073A813A|nr:hypothetical protein [Herbaspirillum rubrisubalbicans]ALU91285.1 hypothetical protein Hrubri_4137 [Herbaspirillum rubrisubalbicans M1]
MPISFISDLDNIAQSLIDISGLAFESAEPELSQPLLRWLDYRLRYIDPTKRSIIKSKGFDQRVPSQAKPALAAFIALARAGKDLNPYQTKMIKKNDSSGTRRQLRTDGLWASWGIYHAHLTDQPLQENDDFSARSEWLLFFIVTANKICLIDIRSHNEPGIFFQNDLVEQAIRSWPNFARQFKAVGVLSLARSPSTNPDDIKMLRTAGVNQMLEIDGAVYMPPGLGMTSAATSSRVSMMAMRIRQNAQAIQDFYAAPDSAPMTLLKSKGIGNPVLSLTIGPSGRLVISCRQTELFWSFPKTYISGDARSELEYLLLPPWAGSRFLSSIPAS